MRPQKRRFGDRKDGWRINSLDPIFRFMPFIMKTRNDANNHFMQYIETAAAEKYIKEKREEGYPGLGMMHIFLAAYVRTVSQRPWINRFVSGQRIYARNDILVSMAVKKELTSDAEESIVKVKFSPSDTIIDVYEKMNAAIAEYRAEGGEETNGTLKVANALLHLPRFLLRCTIRIIEFLDYYGLLPKSLVEMSPFHASLFISNLGSLGIPPVLHHLYNIGNVPVFVVFGTRRSELYLDDDGIVKERKIIDFTVNTDERICDGFYFVRSFKLFRQLMRKPELLEQPPEKVLEDLS